MAFQLEDIVPWGRSLAEYAGMFDLSHTDLSRRILGCGDGPASFNAELSARGGTVISVDPLYRFDATAIRQRIDGTFATVMAETRKNVDEFAWRHIPSVDALGEMRMGAMEAFLADYPNGRADGRYVAGEVPALGFATNAFDLTLCSHFLFLYSQHLELAFHIAAIAELCRLSPETRIFPLLQLGATPSPHVAPVIEHFTALGYLVERVRVPYEFQRGGNEMLRIRRTAAVGDAS